MKNEQVITSSGQYCIDGVTRGAVLDICRAEGIASAQTQFSLSEVYSADEAFVTGTFAGLVPVCNIDGRDIGSSRRGPMVLKLQQLYMQMLEQECGNG